MLEVLERLGVGLHEPEVWALCRECVLAMQRNRLELRKHYVITTISFLSAIQYTTRGCLHSISTFTLKQHACNL